MVRARGSRRSKRLRDEVRARGGPCILCGQPIDYSLPHDHPEAFTVEHRKPWSTHPELREDPANLGPAHASCNKRRGNRAQPPSLGLQSRSW